MDSEKTRIKKVMISGTVRDLPEHRKHVMDACHRQSMFPVMMEHLPASDLEAIGASLKMVDEADIYLGVYAFRYGYVPKEGNPDQISVTEMEYRRAKERGIPRLLFIMDKGHLISFDDVEMGENAEKLKVFKEKVGLENILNFFHSAEELRSFVINSLSQLPKDDKLHQFHYVHPIPAPPEPYVAHPYTLLQARGLFGRRPELNLLTDWITGKSPFAQVRIFNVIAIGGMGKSALTWHWFQNIAPLEMPDMAGRFWWSFYESDAYFENFIIRALAYVSRRSIEEVKNINVVDREAELLRILDREPYLLVLDGLERILIAYARMDAAHLADDDYDKQTANWVARAAGLPESAAQSFTGEHRLRKTADPRAGNFLRKLARVGASRILVSSRLYPFDLQMLNGDPGPGCFAAFLTGLSDTDALDLWRNFGVSGQRDELLRLFRTFENHPLLIQALAGEIARYRPAPGDFDRWRKDKPDFDPFSLPLTQTKSHVLFHSMHGLSEAERLAIRTISAFRMPAQYDTLCALLVGGNKPCSDERQLDVLLNNLEDRGLLGWDRLANRYDLHPVVRGVVWSGVSEQGKQETYEALQGHFEAMPSINYDAVQNIEEISSDIELFHSLIGLKKYKYAIQVYDERISDCLFDNLGKTREAIQLLEKIFPNKINESTEKAIKGLFSYSFLSKFFPTEIGNSISEAEYDNIWLVLKDLILYYQADGKPGESKLLIDTLKGGMDSVFRDNNIKTSAIQVATLDFFYVALSFLGVDQLLGNLKRSEIGARNALKVSKTISTLNPEYYKFIVGGIQSYLGWTLLLKGNLSEGVKWLNKSTRKDYSDPEFMARINSKRLSQAFLWENKPNEAIKFSEKITQNITKRNIEHDHISALCLQGKALVLLNNFPAADERLHHALTRARAISLIEEELPALIALAELRHRQGRPEEAREYLDDVWEAAERGPYPLFHADACNVLCQIERDAGNTEKAIAAAEKAYRLAWCDGPPWAYHYGLENAKKHLRELGAKEPEMERLHPDEP